MIKFGTDGWRAIISEEFTFKNVKIVAQAIADYLIINAKTKKPLIIGYDARFLADSFAEEIAKVMVQNGISCYLTERDTPTPVVAFAVKDKGACGAVMITASHNPYQYCGIKFIPEYAGPASKEITRQIEDYANVGVDIKNPEPNKKGKIERFNPRIKYFKYIDQFFDNKIIKKAGLKIIYDSMYGSARSYVDTLLEQYGCQVEAIHNKRDVLFGGGTPEPSDEHLDELKQKVIEANAQLGLASDGDGDRFGIVDNQGIFYNANQIIALLAMYLIEVKGYKGSIVRSVATTHMLDKIAEMHKMKIFETPVGFKHIASIMMKEKVVIGGEESGGLSILGHIPEKDGILANILVVEMLCHYQKPLSKIYEDLISRIGPHYQKRVNIKMAETLKRRFLSALQANSPKQLANQKLKEVNNIDGVKLVFEDGSWLLIRPSGTEPLIRIYFEADSMEKIDELSKGIESLIEEFSNSTQAE